MIYSVDAKLQNGIKSMYANSKVIVRIIGVDKMNGLTLIAE